MAEISVEKDGDGYFLLHFHLAGPHSEFIIIFMISLLSAFFASFISTLLIIRFKHLHSRFSGDHDILGPQKFHIGSTPRIGGISIAVGILAAILFGLKSSDVASLKIALLLCAIPTFVIGLTEDLTKKIGVKTRLLFTALAASLAVHLLDACITRLDIWGIDYLLSIPFIAIVFTVFAITGLANAYNIIDGFNGLSSMVGIITLLSLAYVSYLLQDSAIMSLSLIMVGAILGFFIWNYPRGLIFLGDGGAYLIGLWIAVLSILLIARHPSISPWFALLVNAYPILETLFTIYRRKIHQGKSPGRPDGIHLHSLIFRRILNPTKITSELELSNANAKTSPYLWVLSSFTAIPAILFWNSTPILIGFLLVFIISYVWLYQKIVRFKTPSWMSIN
jgi:UDP-N-acetylmuramyl pentapeptide phosphotransferase/UDP-N-acetylglucosamine-1-phosphate transferase